MLIGYVRISSHNQDNVAQINDLKEAGWCKKIFQETASSDRWDRPELHKLVGHLRKRDTGMVWKPDRFSRSLKDLLLLLESLKEKGVYFRSLTESIDTSSPAGRMMMQIVGLFAEFEREMLRERTK